MPDVAAFSPVVMVNIVVIMTIVIVIVVIGFVVVVAIMMIVLSKGDSAGEHRNDHSRGKDFANWSHIHSEYCFELGFTGSRWCCLGALALLALALWYPEGFTLR